MLSLKSKTLFCQIIISNFRFTKLWPAIAEINSKAFSIMLMGLNINRPILIEC